MSLLKKIIKFKHSFFHDHGKNNHVFIIDSNGKRHEIHRLHNTKIKFKGDNNNIEIHQPDNNLTLDITIHNNTNIILHQSKYARNICISGFNNNGNRINIGQDFSTTGKMQISLLRGNGDIYIGDDCMFAYDDIIQMGDGHAIYSTKNNIVINNNKDIVIGNHVWLGANVLVLKGAQIPDNSIVGLKSIVTKQFPKSNIIIAGTPAKIIKEDVNWTRESQY